MKKNLLTRAAALCLMLSLLLSSSTVLAASKIAKADAQKTAEQVVPSSCVLRESDWDEDDGEWEFEFRTKDKKTYYDVTVDGDTGAVRRVEMEVKNPPKAKKYTISQSAAKKAVTKKFKGAAIQKVKKTTDDGRKVYRITFKTSSYKGTAEVNGKSGKITEWEKRY